MEFSTFIYFLMASILLTLAPGPDILYLLTKSLADGAKSGVVLAAGLVSGIVFHTFLVMIGVAALIQSSTVAFTALKIFGAAYLFFLAFKSFTAARAGKKISMQKSDARISFGKLYRRGVLMNVLNPKVLLFFLAFLPQFVNFSASPSLQIIFLGVTFALQAFIIFSVIAICAGKVRNLILRKKNLGQLFNYVEAAVLGVIALTLL
ncbi:MAG: LysE family translocator, partial [Selenomonadaceae bacterium]|nr:LysE family translocator [Selenomonadaceae bacterium]